jgi:drug/metabolite transporter (DMT)-like permease
MNSRIWALCGATFVAFIYGATFIVAKDVMPTYIQPFGFILLRVLGATVLFWILGLFAPKEKIDKKDFPRIAAAAFFGVALNMLTFFKGLSLTSPISASVIMVSTPIVVLLFSAIFLKEGLGLRKISGVLIGMSGTFVLIVYGSVSAGAESSQIGNLLVFVNAISYAMYLILIKKLITKYHAFSFIKYIYSFGLLFVLPFGFNEIQQVNWTIIPNVIWLEIGFVLLFTTFFAYLINLMSMRYLKPTTLSVFIYLQPLFSSVIAISLGKDSLGPIKLIAALLIFIGVYLVSFKKKQKRFS